MKGLRVHFPGFDSEAAGVPAEESEFPRFFAPLLPRLRDFHWLLIDSTFFVPDDQWAEFERGLVAQVGRYSLAQPGHLERFGRYLAGGIWCHLLLVRVPTDAENPPDYSAAVETFFAQRPLRLQEPFEGYFRSAESDYWEVFLRDEKWLEELANHWSKEGQLEFRWTNLT